MESYFVTTLIIMVALVSTINGRRRKYSTIATFNAALLSGLPEKEERTALLIEEMRSSSIDVFCLQEVWLVETQQAIYNEVKDLYPNVVSNIDLTVNITTDATLACDPGSLQALGICTAIHCSTASSSTIQGCLVQNCLSELIQMNEECIYCLFVDLLEFQECATQPRSKYLETYGLMLLSRRQLTDVKLVPFVPQMNVTGDIRAYIQANVQDIGDLICTHLTTSLSETEFIGPPFSMPFLFESYGEQQYQELLTLFRVIDDLETPILFGDFNHGPVTSQLMWQFPFHYGFVASRGYVSPYLWEDGRCTFCSSNPFVTSRGETGIDHIYLTTSSIWRMKSVKRIFDDVTTTTGLPLSDHYGVSMTLRNCFSSKSNQLLPLPPVQNELNDICYAAN